MIANINCDGVFNHFLWATSNRNILGSSNVVRLSNCPSLCERVQFLRVSVNSGNAMSVQAGTLSGAHTHRCDSQSRKEEESPELRLFSLSLFLQSLFNPHFTNKIPVGFPNAHILICNCGSQKYYCPSSPLLLLSPHFPMRALTKTDLGVILFWYFGVLFWSLRDI